MSSLEAPITWESSNSSPPSGINSELHALDFELSSHEKSERISEKISFLLHTAKENVGDPKLMEYKDVFHKVPIESIDDERLFQQVVSDMFANHPQEFIDKLSRSVAANVRQAIDSQATEEGIDRGSVKINMVTIKNAVGILHQEMFENPVEHPLVASTTVSIKNEKGLAEDAKLDFYYIPPMEVGTHVFSELLGKDQTHLRNLSKLASGNWYECKTVAKDGSNISFMYHEGTFSSQEHMLQQFSSALEAHATTGVLFEKVGGDITYVIATPEHFKENTLGFYSPKSGAVYCRSDSDIGTYAHETTHHSVEHTLGYTYSAILAEGYATKIEGQFEGSISNQHYVPTDQRRLIQSLSQENPEEVEFSRTFFSKLVGENEGNAYRVGRFLNAFLTEKYGAKAFDQIYAFTSDRQQNLFSPYTGRPILENGLLVGQEGDLVDAALACIGLDPLEVKRQFISYAREVKDLNVLFDQGLNYKGEPRVN